MEKKRLISLPIELDELLAKAAMKMGLPITGIIKVALWNYFKEDKQND